MVLDTSAVIALLQAEPGAERLATMLEAAGVRRLSTASLVEAAVVMLARYGEAGEREIDVFIQRVGIDVVPVTIDQAEMARSAYRRFGKGRHPAALNFGDCFAYALAMTLGEPLLFVGSEFGRTDVEVAA